MTTDNLTDRLAALVSIETRAVVANVVEYEIEREYGVSDDAMAKGARMLALGGIKMDCRDLFVEINGSDHGLDGFADMHLRVMVREGLEARRCQCPETGIGFGAPDHGHRGECERHYEADVPAVQGNKLCGTCYGATPDAQMPAYRCPGFDTGKTQDRTVFHTSTCCAEFAALDPSEQARTGLPEVPHV